MSSRELPTLDGRVVVVTGAGSGIGRALALDAAGRGARLALSDVDAAGLEETVGLVRARSGTPVHTDKLDVRDRAAFRAYAAAVAGELGRVDVVVNNAGIALTGDVEHLDYSHVERIMDVNFWGVVHGTKEFLPHLVASGGGHLVNISSLFGLMAVPGQSAYNASKFAVRGFTEALRQEVLLAGHPVTVTAVHPGGIKTAIARNAGAVGVDQVGHAQFFDKHLARTSAEKAARVILDGALAGKARVLVGADAKALDLLVRATGSSYQRLVSAAVARTLHRNR